MTLMNEMGKSSTLSSSVSPTSTSATTAYSMEEETGIKTKETLSSSKLVRRFKC